MAALETGIPSIRQIQVLIKEGKQVEIKLLTQDVLTGKLIWQDQDCVCLVSQDEQSMMVWRHAIAYIKPQV